MRVAPRIAEESPLAATVRGLAAWPEQDLIRLARAVADELICRRMPVPAALPIVEVAFGPLATSAIADML